MITCAAASHFELLYSSKNVSAKEYCDDNRSVRGIGLQPGRKSLVIFGDAWMLQERLTPVMRQALDQAFDGLISSSLISRSSMKKFHHLRRAACGPIVWQRLTGYYKSEGELDSQIKLSLQAAIDESVRKMADSGMKLTNGEFSELLSRYIERNLGDLKESDASAFAKELADGAAKFIAKEKLYDGVPGFIAFGDGLFVAYRRDISAGSDSGLESSVA